MGKVYKAIEVELGRPVALKLIHHELLAESDSYSRFRQEGKVLSRLQHPGIVSIYRFGIWQERLAYIAMELITGQSLRAIIDQQGHLSSAHAALLGKQICAALQHAHSQHIVHRDLKPGNIVLADDIEQIKVIDFGLARIVSDTAIRQHVTQTGMLVGSVNYMSPEQCMGKKADPRSDINALGCVLYECLSGEPPFQADTPIGLMSLHVNETLTSLQKSKQPVEHAQAWDEILGKALAKVPEKRYQSMTEFAEDLSHLLSGNWVSRISVRETSPNHRRRGAPYLVALSIATLAVLMGTVCFINLNSTAPPPARKNQHRGNTRSLSSTIVTSAWIYGYHTLRARLEQDKRQSYLTSWMNLHAKADPEGESIARAWVCLESANRAGDVLASSDMSHSLALNIPPQVALSPRSAELRIAALASLRAAITNKPKNRGLLLYFLDVLEMLDRTDNQRVAKCLDLISKKDRPNRLQKELRAELKRIFRRSGDFGAEEKILRTELGDMALRPETQPMQS